jgi:hypothetical protein
LLNFVSNWGKPGETYNILPQGYGDYVLSRTSKDDDELCGRKSTSRTENLFAHVKEVIRENRRLTVREVLEEYGVSIGSCHTIPTEDLGMNLV